MANYYYIGTALPPLSVDASPEMTLKEVDQLLRDNLSEKDYRKVRSLRTLYDILNLRSLWLGEALDPWGNLNENDLEEAWLSQVGLPSYVYDLFAAYEKKEDCLRHFPLLLARFFQQAKEDEDEFLKEYFEFEREWRLVFIGFRAKKLGRDLNVELQYENPEEDLIAQMLAQKEAKQYEPPEKYQNLKGLFTQFSEDPLGLERALDEYRFNYVENLASTADSFSIKRILAYMIQLSIVQKWLEDKARGEKIIDEIMKDTA